MVAIEATLSLIWGRQHHGQVEGRYKWHKDRRKIETSLKECTLLHAADALARLHLLSILTPTNQRIRAIDTAHFLFSSEHPSSLHVSKSCYGDITAYKLHSTTSGASELKRITPRGSPTCVTSRELVSAARHSSATATSRSAQTDEVWTLMAR